MTLWLARVAASSAVAAAMLATPAAAAPAAGPAALSAQIAELIDRGGPIIVVLMAVSVFGLAVALIKVVQFTLGRVGEHRFVTPVAARLRAGDPEGAAKLLEGRKGPVAATMRAAVSGRRIRGEDRVVREEVERIAQAQIDSLESGLPLVSLVATISPLLGLLGTVTGLISAFQALAAAGDRVDPAILASGIWEALLTTVMGLAIGIPAAIVHALLQRTVDVAAKRMEDAATQVFTVDLYAAREQGPVAQAAE